ncbi:MAG: AtpZ/AtpI family protein [Caldithrix sp.]|nr:MAG: AtpZ/AtpI family protein [Caldithrix sp.]
MTEDSQSLKKEAVTVSGYFDLGFRFALAIILGTGGGYWLDLKFHTLPLFLIIGLSIGATSGFLTIYRTVFPPKMTKENEGE